MFSSVRRRLTYANVVATLALLFAMSGGALAASHYLITSTSQISPTVLKQLRGRAGPKGPKGANGVQGPAGSPGAQGPAGQSATKLWAVVHTDGTNATLIRGGGATAASQSSPGFINVTFNQNVNSCTYLVTTGLDNFDLPPRGGATADRDPADPSKVYVQTFDLTGTSKALDFFLAVFC